MSYPTSLVWSRIGREAHMQRITKELFEEFLSMEIPPGLAMSLAARAGAIFGNWDPFISTWFAQQEMAGE